MTTRQYSIIPALMKQVFPTPRSRARAADDWEQFELFGQAKYVWFKIFLELPHGIPSHDTFRRVFARLDPDQFRLCFLDRVRSVYQLTQGQKERTYNRDAVISAINEGRLDDAQMPAIRYRPHSLAAKQILGERVAAYLPSCEGELRWLLKDIVETVDITLDRLEKNGPDKTPARETDELLSYIAILWRDPLAGIAMDIEDFLTQQGIIDGVREFYNRL